MSADDHAPPTPVSLPVLRWGPPGGPRALLVHGLTSSGATWWRIASRLADVGWSVVAPDLRGHGSAPSAERYRFVDHAADLAELDDGPWDLVIGHSLAGPILATWCRDRPAIGRLVLLDPVFELADDAFEGVVADQLGELDALDPTALAAAHPAWHPEDVRLKIAAARSTGAHVVERCLRDNAPWHHLDLLAGLTMPTTVLAADPGVGAMFPLDHAASMDEVATFRARVVTGAGHSIQRDDPDAVVAAALATT
ncbi:MAG: alpha/beta hydrolase [Actinomycetota bacterium]|nr:alpha/beta hydrolase [Actinomycetota bacterium]